MKRIGFQAPLTASNALTRLAALSAGRQLRARMGSADELVLITDNWPAVDTRGLRVDDVAATAAGADLDGVFIVGAAGDIDVGVLRAVAYVSEAGAVQETSHVQVVADPNFAVASLRLPQPARDRKLGGVIRLAVAAGRPPEDAEIFDAYRTLVDWGERVELTPIVSSDFEGLRDAARLVDPSALVVRSGWAWLWLRDLHEADLIVTDDRMFADLTLAAPAPVLTLRGGDVSGQLDRALEDLALLRRARRYRRDHLRRLRTAKQVDRQLADAVSWLLGA